MSSGDVDRNVLFGVMAWQLGIIERDPLMAALYTCMTDVSKTLPDVLASAGLLTDDDRRFIEQAVTRQLDKYENDPSRTLANLRIDDELRRDLRNAAMPESSATIVAPDAIDPSAKTLDSPRTIDEGNDPVELGEPSTAAAPPEVAESSRFRVLRPHARGGLGEVFVAVDEELRREVALKKILERHADNRTSRARFLLEAEVTGSLEHPGVVPVYGLGTQADGRPYYAMRFIRGESLEDAIRRFHDPDMGERDPGERAVELRNLLTRFIAVCNTLEYSHSRGIVHRDIKPENIMLGPYGETLVVDWGLGRPYQQPPSDLDCAEAEDPGTTSTTHTTERPTMMGTVVGTPQFMSPEQASGRLDLIRPTSDVYSLGATLYCLLTDHPPFTASDVRRVLRDVQAGTFLPPRRIKSDVPRALEAVCLKAMSLKPEERYQSARALAKDIENWLADEPVSSQRETPVERMQRWMRRHKTWTQAVGAAVVVVAVVSWVAYAREATLRSDLQKSLANEKIARREADDARSLADSERKRAEAHARRAEQQSGLALATLKSVLFDIQAKLKNVPAAHTVRLSMLNTVIDGLKQVARNLDTAAETDHSLVRAHLDLGDIFLQVGAIESTGATAEAERQFRRAVELAEKLREADGKSANIRNDLGDGYQRMGDVSLQRGNLSAASGWLEKSRVLRQALVDEHPSEAIYERALAASIQRLGMVGQQLGNLDAAKDFYSRFFELSKTLLERDPENVESRRNLSVSYERLGDISLAQGDATAAEDFFRKSLEVRRPLAAAADNNSVAVRDMSVTLDRLGDMALQRNDVTAAGDFFTQSLDLRKKLFQADPNNVQAQRDLVVSYALLGDVMLRKSDVTESLNYYRQYHEMAQKLAAGDPENVQLQRDLATSFDRLGYVTVQSGKAVEARDLYRKNYELLEKLSAREPENVPVRRDLARATATLGDLSLQLGDFATGREFLAKYLAETRRRSAERSDDRAARRSFIDALMRQGDLDVRVGALKQAGTVLNEAHEKAKAAIDADPNDLGQRIYLANVGSLLAMTEIEQRNAEAAAGWLQKGVAAMRFAANKSDDVSKKQMEDWIAEQSSLLSLCIAAGKAVDDPTTIEKQDPAVVVELLDFVAAAEIRGGKWDEAEKRLDQLAEKADKDGGKLFLAARRAAFALASIDDADAAQKQRREKLTTRVFDLLSKALEAGAFDDPQTTARLEFADDFATIRTKAEYAKLLETIRRKPPESSTAPTTTSGGKQT